MPQQEASYFSWLFFIKWLPKKASLKNTLLLFKLSIYYREIPAHLFISYTDIIRKCVFCDVSMYYTIIRIN